MVMMTSQSFVVPYV